MKTVKDIVKRIEVAIPYNKNTFKIIEDIQSLFKDIFGGYTLLETPEEGGMYTDKDGKERPEKTNLFIIYYNPIYIPDAEEALGHIAEMLVDKAKEDESWVLSHLCDRIIHSQS